MRTWDEMYAEYKALGEEVDVLDEKVVELKQLTEDVVTKREQCLRKLADLRMELDRWVAAT